ncbi:HTH-type transcriptional activator TipA [Clostridium aceticum]|uniref:HTH-type transcriptional activator TipA n=1 Tax=Clostridium aceticum TaxID=84022 RepID=A0A0D8IBK8_9CLOT|nr:MerR family transcriptional regulator [Clostridium aceticum]AKL96491.1 HTH-type transcriptional activator TipA [Clostridium aceticum]KJF27337.1 MerR family transcriptional regulator [Clostridium aceticum]
MEYTIQKIAKLAGISTRTLRYYDEIGILKPARINSSGYRIYGEKEVDKLQQILFYKELDLDLIEIRKIIASPKFDEIEALKEHKEKLIERSKQLQTLITNVSKTISHKERKIMMSDKEKFEGFKNKLVDDNEKKYGKETREKYGDEAVNRSKNKLKNMTQEEYKEIAQLENKLYETLSQALKTGDPAGKSAQEAAELHRQWISFNWDTYSKEAHAGLVQMYVDDERFKEFYDKKEPGTAEFLRDAVYIYTGIKKK